MCLDSINYTKLDHEDGEKLVKKCENGIKQKKKKNKPKTLFKNGIKVCTWLKFLKNCEIVERLWKLWKTVKKGKQLWKVEENCDILFNCDFFLTGKSLKYVKHGQMVENSEKGRKTV